MTDYTPGKAHSRQHVDAPADYLPGQLPAPIPARSTDPATSRAAALKARERFARNHAECILGVLWRAMSIHEIAKVTGFTPEQVARRMPELEREGRARPTGETRTSPAGCASRVWERIV